MTEESDAGSGPGDGDASGDGEHADSAVEPPVEPDGAGSTAEEDAVEDDAPDEADGDGGDADAPTDSGGEHAGGDDTESGDDTGDTESGDDGDARDAEGATAIGAVTDASEPPAASASGADARDAGPADDDGSGGAESEGADDDGDGADAGGTTFDARESMEADDWAKQVAESSSEVETAGVGTTEEPAPEPEPEAATAEAPATAPGGAPGELPGEGAMPEGPPDDQEMPLADHVEEMVLRLAVVCGVATVVAGTVFFFEPIAENVILFIWDSVIPSASVSGVPTQVAGTAWPGHYVVENVAPSNPRVYGPLELKLTELKFASLVGFVVALPVFVYETYRFMRPGLYPHERRYYLAAIPTSLVLAFVGVSFAYFIILPAIFAYFVRYSERAGLLAFALRQTFDLILVLMGYMALVFQIPLFIMLAIMMGLTDRVWLEDRRLYFWGGFLGVSFLFVPEPTGMAPILVALTMIGLFEGTLALLRWTGN